MTTLDFPQDTLIVLSRARAGVRGLLQQIEHPVAHFALSKVADHLEEAAQQITAAMVAAAQDEADRIAYEDTPQEGII